jgi:heme/copper-type cytochrome/quinol oxidase subunit 4
MLAGAVAQIGPLVASIRHREALGDQSGDPWDGRSLEWSTGSPPPLFSFAVLPDSHDEDAYGQIKERAFEQQRLMPAPDYQPIEMPRNGAAGFARAVVAAVGGFGAVALFTSRDRPDFVIPAEAAARIGVHLVVFRHVTSGPDNTNTILALAFGVLIVALVVLGSLWIMTHLSHQVMPMSEMMRPMRRGCAQRVCSVRTAEYVLPRRREPVAGKASPLTDPRLRGGTGMFNASTPCTARRAAPDRPRG